jgi:hypothetical protein
LQRDGQRCLEADDSDNSNRNVRQIAIKAVQEHDRGTAASLPQECATERKRGEKDEEEIAELEHHIPLSGDRRNSGNDRILSIEVVPSIREAQARILIFRNSERPIALGLRRYQQFLFSVYEDGP